MKITRLLGLALSLSIGCSSAAPPKRPPEGTGGEGGEGDGGESGSGGAGGTTLRRDAGSTGDGGSGGTAGMAGGTGGAAGMGGGTGGMGTAGAPADAGADGPALPPPGPTDLTKLKYRKAVKLNTTATGAGVAGNVAAFPVAVQLTASTFDFTQARDHGEDVRFATTDGALLPYAVESWDKAGAAAVVWVKVDVRGNDAAQSFDMHWGSADAADASDSRAVFATENGFVGAWHLNEDGNNDPDGYRDASANQAHATGVMMAPGSSVPARVGRGTWLQNSAANPKDQWIKVDSDKRASFQTGPKPITVSLWALAKSFPNRSTIGGYETIISKGDTSWTLQREGTTTHFETCVRTPPYHSCAISKTSTALNTWFHFAIVFASPTITLYINGAKDATSTDPNWLMGDHPLGMGQQTQSLMGKRNWDGVLDEVRVANVARSADWIKLDFESQKEGQKLVTFGPAQAK